jgi:signal transduction histidine kinase
MMRDEDFTLEEMREFSADINREAQRLNRMITEMLDLDRMESGLMKLSLEAVDLARLAADVAAQLAPMAPAHRVVVEKSGSAATLDGDRDKLTQVVTNLLSNAIKYSPNGGTVRLRVQGSDTAVCLEVEDEGVGIPRAAVESIFERYTRVETGSTRHIQGTGLGLPIVRQIVEMHGGQVSASSALGSGSTFRVWLPRCRTAHIATGERS